MQVIIIALILLAVAVTAIYLLLKNMGEDGIEVAAPGSCKSRGCGTRCAPNADAQYSQEEELLEEAEEVRRKEAA